MLVFVDLFLALSTSCKSKTVDEECTTLPVSDAIFFTSVSILVFLTMETFLKIILFGRSYILNFFRFADTVVVIGSLIMELYIHYSEVHKTSKSAIVLLHIWKMLRAMVT